MKRLYRLWCIDCAATLAASPGTVWCEHVVTAMGVMDAWDIAKADGYWPVHVIESRPFSIFYINH